MFNPRLKRYHMAITIQHAQTCQQQNSTPYPNLVRYKKPLIKKRTGYKNYVPNSWETDIRFNPFHRSICNYIYSNEGEFRASIPNMAKACGMAERTFKKYKKELVELGVVIQTKTKSGWQGANHYCINPEYIEKAIWGCKKPKSKKFTKSHIGSLVPLLRSKPTVYRDAELEWDGLLDDNESYQHLTIVPEYGDLGQSEVVELHQHNNKKSDKKENKKINIAVDAVPLSLLRTPQAEERPATLGVLERLQRRRRTEKDMKASDVLKKRVKEFKKDENKKNINHLVNQLCGVTDKSKLKTRFGLKDRSFIRTYSDD
jgi:hypothetical protein